MESNPIQNRLKDECVDRISNLPDSILGKILSYIPTKYAAATCILSTRWRNLFPFEVHPLNLELDDSLLLNLKRNEAEIIPTNNSFVDFVDRLLNDKLCHALLLKFDLGCGKQYGDAKIISWVRSALELNVEKLMLRFFLEDSMKLFNSLNGCPTLVTLHLGKNFDLCLPGFFILPKLKTLFLDHLKFYYETGSIQELVDGCPLLEKLSFYGCDWQLMETLCIRCPKLEDLYIEECWDETECELVLDTPNLKGLFYRGYAAVDYSLTNFKCLEVAYIDVGPSKEQLEEAAEEGDDNPWYFDDCVAKLVSACSGTTRLYLSNLSIAALERSTFPVPTFQNLVCLVLGCMGTQGWKFMACLLQSAPILEKIVIEEGFDENEGGYAGFESLLPSLPKCLEKHTKKIDFLVFKGKEDEIKLIEYFLRNCKVLQAIMIHCLPFEDTSILTRLSKCLKQSKICRILLKSK